MFRGLLSSRLIQIGLIFFIVVVGGSPLYVSLETQNSN